MKIGMFTFFSINYGAVLQAYSLQRTIKANNPQSEVALVDFKRPNQVPFDKVFFRRSSNPIFNIIWQILVLLRYKQFKKRTKSFVEFKSKLLFTKQYTSITELLTNPPSFDIYISGSDQVFNPKNQYRDVFFLNFAKGNSKKIAYAPSFGVNQFSNQDKMYIKLVLSDFDALSCREIDGANFMSELMNEDIPHVLDPVFLTSVEQWRSIEITPDFKFGYIFVYCLKDLKKLLKIAKEKYPNKLIVVLAPNDLRYYMGCRQIYYPGPQEFLGLIDHADAIITDSFHGTSFSIIFGKVFHTVITRPSVSSRIYSLLQTLKLENRIVALHEKNMKDEDVVSDYNGLLDELIIKSSSFLNYSIGR